MVRMPESVLGVPKSVLEVSESVLEVPKSVLEVPKSVLRVPKSVLGDARCLPPGNLWQLLLRGKRGQDLEFHTTELEEASAAAK